MPLGFLSNLWTKEFLMNTFFDSRPKNNFSLYCFFDFDNSKTGDLPGKEEMENVRKLDHSFFPFPWTEKSWNETMALAENYLLMTVNDKNQDVKAFSLWRVSKEERLWHLLKVVVEPEARSQGIGEHVLRESMRMAKSKGFESCFLEVEETNCGATRLYEKLGFKKLHLAKNFYGSGRNAFKMSKNLK